MQRNARHDYLGVTLECVKGDIIAQLGFDAVVNAANPELRPGGGVAGAIHRAAGPELDAECRPHAPLFPGQAVITPAYRLPNRYVIHCLGPVYAVDEPAAHFLASCYRNALAVADEAKLRSVAFPAISTGGCSYPVAAATEIAVKTVLEELPSLWRVNRIRFVSFDDITAKIYEKALLRALQARARHFV